MCGDILYRSTQHGESNQAASAKTVHRLSTGYSQVIEMSLEAGCDGRTDERVIRETTMFVSRPEKVAIA